MTLYLEKNHLGAEAVQGHKIMPSSPAPPLNQAPTLHQSYVWPYFIYFSSEPYSYIIA